MKLDWQRFMARVDALSLRERVIVFAMTVLIFLLAVNSVLLDPLYTNCYQSR